MNQDIFEAFGHLVSFSQHMDSPNLSLCCKEIVQITISIEKFVFGLLLDFYLSEASEVREAILPETTKKILTYVQDFGEGDNKPEGNNTKFLGKEDAGRRPANKLEGNNTKFLGKEDAGRRPANKPEGNNTKFLGKEVFQVHAHHKHSPQKKI